MILKGFVLGIVGAMLVGSIVIEAWVRWRTRRALQREVNLDRLSPSLRRALQEETSR
jgi:hypothetical protein